MNNFNYFKLSVTSINRLLPIDFVNGKLMNLWLSISDCHLVHFCISYKSEKLSFSHNAFLQFLFLCVEDIDLHAVYHEQHKLDDWMIFKSLLLANDSYLSRTISRVKIYGFFFPAQRSRDVSWSSLQNWCSDFWEDENIFFGYKLSQWKRCTVPLCFS